MWKVRAYVRELNRVFSLVRSFWNAHIARIVVLYHDLELELFATVDQGTSSDVFHPAVHRDARGIRGGGAVINGATEFLETG